MQLIARPLKVTLHHLGLESSPGASARCLRGSRRGIVAAAVSAHFRDRSNLQGYAGANLLVPITS